jgi:hypothetical protein
VRERAPESFRVRESRRDDELLVDVTDPAGTTSRPPRVQSVQTDLVEPVDHLPHGAATSRAIADTGVPPADAMIIIARRTRTVPCLPRRTICNNRRPSTSVNRRARTGPATDTTHLDRRSLLPSLNPPTRSTVQPHRRVTNPANVHGHRTD